MKSFLSILLILLTIAFSPLSTFAQKGNESTVLTGDKYVIVDGHKMHYQTGGTIHIHILLIMLLRKISLMLALNKFFINH